ncbi:MAG: Gfo/Idh/MocA family protein [Candidatus Acetothermia bacterium]
MSTKVDKIGIIGAGNWGKNVVRNFYEILGPEKVVVCDSDEERLERAEGDNPGITTAREAEQVIEDTDLPAISIATPAPTHYELSIAALEAGKHVLVEKPIALDVENAREMIELAEEKDLTLMVDHLLEYHPVVDKLKALLSEGELGDVYYAYGQRVNLGVVRTKENALWSLGPHDVSVLLYLFGVEPEAVHARGGTYLQKDRGVEDVVFLDMDFDGDLMAHTHLSWLDPHKIRKMTLVGSEKMAVFDDMESTDKLKIFDKGAASSGDGGFNVRYGDMYAPNVKLSEPLKEMCLHFIDSVENGNRPRSDGYDGLRVLRVLEAGERSLNTGEWEKVG